MTLAHSTSAAASRSSGSPADSRSRLAASAMSPIFDSMTCGTGPPTAPGQKWVSWRSAAEWNVRAWTRSSPAPGTAVPSCRSRARSSAAARVVKVTARTRAGSAAPVAAL